MKIISYNLLEGARRTGAEFVEFVVAHAPDLVCLQEANGWNGDGQRRAKAFAAEAGLPYFVFGESNTPFHLVTFSRLPFTQGDVHTDGFWHSAIHAGVLYDGDTLDVWNLHLDPRDEDSRLREATRMLTLMRSEQRTGTGRKVVAMGDLNSLSSAGDYAPELWSTLRAAGISKFGTTGLRHDVMDRFADGGLVDAAHALGTHEWTVSTPANTDSHHAARLRLDYLLASRDVLPFVTSAVVDRGGKTDRISDHYPLVVTLR